MKHMTKNINARDIVLKYIENLDSLEYDKAKNYLDDRIKISGPAGEQFANSTNFIKMLKNYNGKYDIKKVFFDDNDVCVLYDLITDSVVAFMSSWYKIENEKIVSIKTIFDSKLFPIINWFFKKTKVGSLILTQQ